MKFKQFAHERIFYALPLQDRLLSEILKDLKQNDDENALMQQLKNFQKNRFDLSAEIFWISPLNLIKNLKLLDFIHISVKAVGKKGDDDFILHFLSDFKGSCDTSSWWNARSNQSGFFGSF